MIAERLFDREIETTHEAHAFRPRPVPESSLLQRTCDHAVSDRHDLLREQSRIEAIDVIERKLALVHFLDEHRSNAPSQRALEVRLAFEILLVVQNKERASEHEAAFRRHSRTLRGIVPA